MLLEKLIIKEEHRDDYEQNKNMNLKEAQVYAEKYKFQLEPFCERIEIAGSISREKPDNIKDIEIVLIPKMKTLLQFKELIESWYKVKGDPVGKYTQRITAEGIKLDIFIAKKENWGLILAIRTGSADYSHYILANGWVRAGFKSIDGMLTKDNKQFPLYEEKELFDLIKIKYTEPKFREYPKGVNHG